MTAVNKKASTGFKLDMWVGDVAAFMKVVAVCRELELEAVRILTSKLGSEEDRAIFWERHSFYEHDEMREMRWQENLASQTQGIENALRLSMSSKQKRFSQELSGPPEDVLKEVDLEDLLNVTLKVGNQYSPIGSGGFNIQINFSRESGCEVAAAAPDSDWVLLLTPGPIFSRR